MARSLGLRRPQVEVGAQRLNSILGYSQILLKGEALANTPREAVQTIQRSGEHLLQLVDGLLDLARIEAGRLRLEPIPVPLPDFLEGLVSMVRPQAEAKGVDFSTPTAAACRPGCRPTPSGCARSSSTC